ncbi:peptidase inhibitor family I36 protein [Streptomyces sp. NPDC005955]|uniref:peptidase inhibitor family I36 protein n=1 Tax=Streptomyces sp. NPDC005955 TaxID=3364738 RepID=UPI0036D16B87
MMRRNTTLTGLAITTLLTFGVSGQSLASTPVDPLQQQINEVLANTQGGVQISRNEISWGDGEAIMSFPLPGERNIPADSPAARKIQAEAAGLPVSALSEPSGIDPEPARDITRQPDCPTEAIGNDWYCFYQHKDYGGRRLMWNEAKSRHNPVFFSQYDFNNKVSSWSNKGAKTITVANRTVTGNDESCKDYNNPIVLWKEYAHTDDRAVDSTVDNKADCFWTTW